MSAEPFCIRTQNRINENSGLVHRKATTEIKDKKQGYIVRLATA
jgi:hypothetical protein